MATITRRPTGDGNYTDWTPLSGSDHFAMVDEVTPDDDTSYNIGDTQGQRDSFTFPFAGDDAVPSGAINIAVTVKWRAKKFGEMLVFKNKPFLRFSSTDNDGTEITETVDYTDHSEQLTKPGGGAWTVAEINSANWEAGLLLNTYSGIGLHGRATQLYVEISYDAAATDEAPTSLQCDRSTNPTGVGDTPIFTALYQAQGDSGTADRYKIEVSEASDFSSFKWQSGEQALSPTCTDNQRCKEIAYGGTSLKSDVTYYWRIQLYQSGRTPTWSTATATFKGIDRDWEDAKYPVRRKLTVDADHDGIASGELLSFDFETGKRIILASDGCFDEAIQASGGFSIARYASRTHVAYLSRLESVNGQLGIRVVTINHITGEMGVSHYIDTSGTTFDTHYFPVIDVTPDGYIHCFYGAHGGSYRYRRSKYPNESGSLSTDHTDAAMWVRPDTGADAYMTITGFTGTYAIPFHIPIGDDAGRLYCFCRSGTSYRYIFVYSDDSGVSWSAVHRMIDDTSASHYRVYMYGVRFDRKEQRLHISWTHNFTGDTEQGIWYAYCDYDETDGSSLNVGFNIFRWADGTLAGRTKTTGAQVPIDYTVGQAITTSTAELSKVFTETLVIDKNGDPVIFWEQKFDQGTNLWAHQTNLMCARWSGSAWVIYCISDQVNTKLRVRRSSVAIGLDKDGVIHALMPVASKTQWRQLATGDDDSVGVTRASGTDNYAMIDDGFTRIDQATWLKMSAVDSKASFTHGTSNADDIKKIFTLEVIAFAKSTGSASAIKLYIDNGTTTNLGSSQAVSTSAITRYTAEWTTNPFTAVAWATGDIAGLRFGVQCDSTNEVQVFSVFMRFTFMRSTDENLGAAELHELTSSDNGVTWQIQERSRNSMIGVPMMNHPHHLTGDVFQAIWTSGHDVFYYSNERFGLMLPTGVDVRIMHGATEIDRVGTYWNLNKSRISFKAQEAITAGETAGASDYYLEYGNRNAANDVQGAPGDVWEGFWNFEEMVEGAGIGSHADWTVAAGAASVYSSLTNHRNKVYAGNHAIKSSSYPFEAFTAIGTNVADVFIEAGIWMEGSGNYSYIAARDGTTEFRVGVNAATNRPAYYDGSWHDITTAGYADRANMNNFAILVTASGCSAWVNGIRICHEVTCITVVDQIRIGCASQSYFDLIRWSKRPYSTKDYTTTTGFDKALAYYTSDHTATKETNDAYHNIPTTPWQKSRITRVDVTVDVRDQNSEDTGFTISTHCWIGGTSPYDSADTVDDSTHVHTGIDGGAAWQGSYIYSFTDLNIGPKSVKVDSYAGTQVEGPDTSEARITQIKIWTEDRDPVIVIGDAEWRGFRMDAVMEGAGQFSFLADANTDAAFIRRPQPARIANLAGLNTTPSTTIGYLGGMTTGGQVTMEHGVHLQAYQRCLLELLRGSISRGVAPLEWGGQPTIVQQVAIGSLAGLSSHGQVSLGFQLAIAARVLTPIEIGLAVAADGQVVFDFAGGTATRGLILIQSSQRIDADVALPFEILASALANGQTLVEHGAGLTTHGQVLLAYIGSLTTQGQFIIDHLAILTVHCLANTESGSSIRAQGLVPFACSQALEAGQVVLPIAWLGRYDAAGQLLVESGVQMPATAQQLVLDSGAALSTHGYAAIENLGTLLTDVATKIEWLGNVAVSAFGQLAIAWTGAMTARLLARQDTLTGTAAEASVRQESGYGLDTDQQVVTDNLTSPTATEAAQIEHVGGYGSKHQAAVEYLAGADATAGVFRLDFTGGTKADMQTLYENLGAHRTNLQTWMEHNASMASRMASLLEWGERRYMQGKLPMDILTALEYVRQFPIEWTGGQSVTLAGLFPIEWSLMVNAEGLVRFDHGAGTTMDALFPLAYGIGYDSPLRVNIAVDALARMITQVSLEALTGMQAHGVVNFDTGLITQPQVQAVLESSMTLAAQMRTPEEWLGAEILTLTGRLPLSWRSSLAARQQANVETLQGLEMVRGVVVIDWGLGMEKAAGQYPYEHGRGVRTVADVLASWLQTIGATGRISMDHRGYMPGMTMRVDIEYGAGMVTRTMVPFDYCMSLVAQGKLPMEWIGFAVTMFTVLWAEARLPGVVGAAAKVPGVGDAMAKLISASSAAASTAAAADAMAIILKVMNERITGGVTD